MVRTIDGDIIVADDDGEVLTDDRDDDTDHEVDPDDEGVELLTDGGTIVDRGDRSPGDSAACIAALRPGDTVDVWVDDGTRKVVSGDVASHGQNDDLTVVAFDTFESTPRRCALRFRGTTNDPDVTPVLFDPRAGDTFTVRRVERR